MRDMFTFGEHYKLREVVYRCGRTTLTVMAVTVTSAPVFDFRITVLQHFDHISFSLFFTYLTNNSPSSQKKNIQHQPVPSDQIVCLLLSAALRLLTALFRHCETCKHQMTVMSLKHSMFTAALLWVYLVDIAVILWHLCIVLMQKKKERKKTRATNFAILPAAALMMKWSCFNL